MAICEGGGKARAAGRIKTRRDALVLFAQSLAPDDKVVLEASGNSPAIARILQPHVDEVVIANPRRVRAISHAKVKVTSSTRARWRSCWPPTCCAACGSPTSRSQSGATAARMGRITKEGSAEARRVLVEAAWAVKRTPGPLRAFGQRVQARRGAQIATVAVARKIAVLSWHLLTRGEDYAHHRPTLHRRKLRKLELRAGAPSERGKHNTNPIWETRSQDQRERDLVAQAEAGYQRMVADRANRRQTPAKTRHTSVGLCAASAAHALVVEAEEIKSLAAHLQAHDPCLVLREPQAERGEL